MRCGLIVTILLGLTVAPVFAGLNEGGVLVVHHDPEAILTNACSSITLPDSCGGLNPTAPANGEPQLWFVLAAFPDSVPDRLNTITFGLGDYDSEDLVMGLYGPCHAIGNPIEVSGPGWPGPNTGTAVSWAPDCLSGDIVPVYWFETYAYSAGKIPLTSHPTQGSTFVSCSLAEDSIDEYAEIGFGLQGANTCPDESALGPLGGIGSSEDPYSNWGPGELDDLALIVTDTESPSFMETIRSLRIDYNFHILLAMTPDAVVARLSPELADLLEEDARINFVTYDFVSRGPDYESPEEIPLDERWTRYAWNKIHYAFGTPRSIPDPPPVMKETQLGDSLMLGAHHIPAYAPNKQTSVYLIGDVGFRPIFVESIEEDCPCPPTENFTINNVLSPLTEMCEALVFLADYSTDANLSFFIPEPPVYPAYTEVEPITTPTYDAKIWIHDAMSGLGYDWYPEYAYLEQCWAHNNDLREIYALDWAFLAFIVDDDAANPDEFPDGLFAYAYLYGPLMVMTIHNGGWGLDNCDMVTRHEICHIFGAADEYEYEEFDVECSCSDRYGYLGVPNANCITCAESQVPCIMADSPLQFEDEICPWTMGQLGWRNADGDGPLDPLDHPDSEVTMLLGTSAPLGLGDVVDIYYDAGPQLLWVKRLMVSPRNADSPLGSYGTVWDGIDWAGYPWGPQSLLYQINGSGSYISCVLVEDQEETTISSVIIDPGPVGELDEISFAFADTDTHNGRIRGRIKPKDQSAIVEIVFWDELKWETVGNPSAISRSFGPMTPGIYELDLSICNSGGIVHETVEFQKGTSAGVDARSVVIPEMALRPLSANPGRDWFEWEVVSSSLQECEMKVVGADGRTVKTWGKVRLPGGIARVLWDGKNNSGERVSTGVYYLSVLAEGVQLVGRDVIVLQ